MLTGVAVTIFGNFVTSLGVILQKKFIHTENPPVLSWQYLWGIVAIIVGLLMDAFSLLITEVAIVGVLTVTSIVFNTLLSYIILKEPISKELVGSNILLICGCATIVFGQQDGTPINTVEEFEDRYITTISLIYYTFSTLNLVIWWVISKCNVNWGIMMAIAAGISAADCLFLLKAISDGFEFTRFVLLLVPIITVQVLIQLSLLIASMTNYPVVKIANVYTAITVLFAILISGIVYDDFGEYGWVDIVLLCTGMFITSLGIVSLMYSRKVYEFPFILNQEL